MMSFRKYLSSKKYQHRTIKSYEFLVEKFSSWRIENELSENRITYAKLLDYISLQQENGLSNGYLNDHLTALRHYFDYLVSLEVLPENPAAGLVLKGVTRRLPHDLLSFPELENLYESSKEQTFSQQRNKEMLGLMCFQGVKTGELLALQSEDIDLEKGTVFIKGSSKSNSRTMVLEPRQLSGLKRYTLEIRDSFLQYSPIYTTRLFIGATGQNSGKYLVVELGQQLKKRGYSIKQLRPSIIRYWLENNNLRKAQYLAGHKWISSTERYLSALDPKLLQAVDQYHPLNY